MLNKIYVTAVSHTLDHGTQRLTFVASTVADFKRFAYKYPVTVAQIGVELIWQARTRMVEDAFGADRYKAGSLTNNLRILLTSTGDPRNALDPAFRFACTFP